MAFLLVNLLGLAVIGGIVWYFFLSKRAEEGSAAAVGGGSQEVHVTIKGGYIPEVIHARPGLPLRIHFRREETSPCSEEVVFPELGIRRQLPAFETTAVDIPAPPAGRYRFSCAMDMMHGRLQVEEHAPSVDAATPAPTAADRDAWPLDPICGMRVNPERPAATAIKDGVTYYFCNPGCKVRFEQGGPAAPMGEVRVELRRSRR